MDNYHFHYEIPIRYGDLDPQGHVNNARYATFIEQARVAYLAELGLWNGENFLDLGVIVADVHISYLAPLYYGQFVRVGIKVARIGNKSLVFEYSLVETKSKNEVATASTVMVAFDYHTHQTIPVSASWRKKIATYEGIPEYEQKT